MTKGEFIDEVANRTGLSKKDAGAAVDAVLGTISDTLKGGWRRRLHRLRQVPRHEALGTHRREPAEPGSEGSDPRGDRAEVLRRLDAQGGSPGLRVCWRWRPPDVRTCVRMAGRTPPPRGPRPAQLQLELGAADRLAALIEEIGEPLAPERAAGALLALPRVPGELARRVLAEVVDDDSRLVRHQDGRVGLVGLAPPPATPLADAAWTVVDLETTGVGASARIVEIGAVRIEGVEQVATMSRLVDPGIPMPPRISELTGIRDRDLRGAGPLRPALAELLALARGSIFVAHNASFDVGMLDRALMRLDGTRIGMRVLDTVGLARRLLAGRIARFDLGSVSERFDVTVRPCHRALPDALATGEVLLALIGLAQERGAETRRGRHGARAGGAAPCARRGGISPRGCPPARASTSCAIASGRRSTSARRATCARACARTSARAGSRRGSRVRSRRSSGSRARPRDPSSRPRSASSR